MTCQNGIHIPHTFYLSQFDLTYSSRRCNQSSCLQLHQCRCIKCSNQCRHTRQHNKSMVKIKPPNTQPGDWKLKVTSSDMDGQIIRACALNDNTIERKDVQITPNFKSCDRSESTYNHELLCQYSPTFANTTKECLKLSCTPQDCFKVDIKQVGSSPVFDSNIHRHNVDSLLSSFSSLWKPGARFGKSSSEGEHSSSSKRKGRFTTGSSSCEGEHSPLPKRDRRFETRSGSYEGEHSPSPKRDRHFETRSGSGEEKHSPFLKESIPFQKSTSNFDAEISKPGFTLDNLINTPIHPNSNSSPIKSHFLKLANQNIPGDEPVCYHKVRDECRKYLEQMLTTPDRRMVEAVYFDALERLNNFSSALLEGKCKDSKHDANFRFLTNGAIDNKETSIGLLNFNDKFLQSNNEAMKESCSFQLNFDRQKMKRYLEMLKHLKNELKELEKVRQSLRHELSYESKSMSKRHNLNHRYFQTLDELNQTKIRMKNLKKYLESNIINLPTGQISKNYTNEMSDQKMAPKHRPLDLSFSVMDIARGDKQTKRNGSVVCHPSFHLSEPSSFTNITSLDDHVCLSTTHSLVGKERKKEERPSIFREERGKQLLMVNFPVERQRKEEELSEDNDTDSFERNEELCNKDMQDTEDKDSINEFESGDEFIQSQDIVNFSEVESSPHLKSDFENSEHLESKDDATKEGKSTLRPHRIAKGEESRGCARPIKEERSYCEQVFTKRTSLNEKTNIQENHHRENNYLKKENTNKKCDKNYRNVTDKFSFRINKVKRVTNIKSEFLENANYPLECRVNNKIVEKNNNNIEKSSRQNKIKTYKEFCADEVNKINDTDSFEKNEELCNEDMQDTEDKDSMKELNIGDRHIQSQDIVKFWECESSPYSNSHLENSEHLELKDDATKRGNSTLRSYEIAKGVESQGCARPIKEEISYCEQMVTERTFFNGKANIQKNHHRENNYLKKENTNDKYERNNKNDTDRVSLDINKGGQGTNNESEFPENANHPLERRVNNKTVDKNSNNIEKSSRQNKIKTYKEFCADEVNKINDTDSFEKNEELCNEDMQDTEDKDSMKELNIGDRHIQSQDIVNFWECESCPYSNSDLENSEHLELKYDETKEGKSTLRSYEIAEGVECRGCARPIKEEVSHCEQVFTKRTSLNEETNIQENHHRENNYLKKENTNKKCDKNYRNVTDKSSFHINKVKRVTNIKSEFLENANYPLECRVNNKTVDKNNNNFEKSSRQNKIKTFKESCADEVNGSDNDFVDSDVTLEKEKTSRICNSFYSVPERRLNLINNIDLGKDVKEEEEGEDDLTEVEIRGGKTSNTRTDVLKQTVRNGCEEQSPRKKDVSHKQQIFETAPTEYYHKLVHQKEIPSSSDSHHVPTRTTSSNSDMSSPVGKLRHTYDNDSMKKNIPAIEVYELLHLRENKANLRVDTKADCTGSDDSDSEYTQAVRNNRGIYFRDNSNKLKDTYQVYGSQSFTKAPVTETYNQMFLQNNESMPSSVLNMESPSTNGIKKLNNIVIKCDEEYFNEGIDVVDPKEKVRHEQKQMNQCEYEDKRATSFDPNDDESDASTRSYSEAFKDFDSSERFSEEDDFTSDKYRPEKSDVLPLNHTHKNNSSDGKNESEPIRKEIRAQNNVVVDRENEGGHVFSINEEIKDNDDAIPISQGRQADCHYKRHFTTRNAQNNLPSCESDRFFTIHNSKCITSPHLPNNSTDVEKIRSNIATQTSSHRKSYKDKEVNVATEELFQPIPSTSIRHSIETNGESRIHKTEAEGYKNKLLCEKDVLSTSENKEKGKCLPIKQDTATQTTPIAACVKMSDDSDISIGDISNGVDNIKNFNNKAKTERRKNRTKCGSKEVAVQTLQQVSEIDKFESADVLSKHQHFQCTTMDIFHSNDDSILDTRLSTLTCDLHDLNHSFSSLLRIAQGSSTSEKEGNEYGNVQRQFIAHDEKDNDPFQQQYSREESHHTYLLLNHYSDEIVQKVVSAVFMEAKFSVSLMQDNCMPFNCGDVFTMASDRIGQKVGDDVTKRFTSTKWHRLEKRKKKIFIQKKLKASSFTCDQENSTVTATGKNMSIDKKQYSRERKDTKLLSKMHTTNGIKNCYRKERNDITDFQNGVQKCNSDEEYEMAFGFPECKDELKTAILTVKCNEDGDIVNPKGKKRSVGVNDDLSIRQEFDVLFGNSNINVLQTKTSTFPVTKTDNRMKALSFDDDFIPEPSYVREQTSAGKITHTRSSHFYIDLNSTTDSGFETMENFEDSMEQVSCVKEHRKIYPLIQHNKVLKFGAMESCDFTTNEIQYPLVTTGEVVRTAKLMRCISIDNDGRDVSRDNNKRFVKVEKIINVSNEVKRIQGKAKEAKRRSREKAKIKDGIFKEENDERKIFEESKKKKEEEENNNKSIKLRKRKSKKYRIQKPSNEYLSTDSTGANKNKEEIYEGNLNEGDKDKDWIFADDSNTQNNNIDKVNWNNKFATISPIKSCVNMSTTEDVSLVTLSLENGQTNLDEIILPNSVFKADGMCERVDGNGFYNDAYQENNTGDKRTFILYEGNDMHFNVESISAEMLPIDYKFGKVAQSNTFNGGTDNKIASLIKNANEVTRKTGNDQDYIERPSILGSSPTISDYIFYPEQHYLNGASVSDQKSGLPLAINNSGKDTQKALTKTLAEENQFIEKMSDPLSLRCNNSRQDAIANTSDEKSQESTDVPNINNTPLQIMSVQPNVSPINSHSKLCKKATSKHKKLSNDHGEGSILKNKNKFKRWNSTEFEGIMRDINITDEEELFLMVQSDDIKPQKNISHNLLFKSPYLKEKDDMFHHYVDEENGLPNSNDVSQLNTTLDGKMHELLINAQGNTLGDVESKSGKHGNTIYMKSNASFLDDKCIDSNKDLNLTDEFPPNSTNQVSESENQITASFSDLIFMDQSGEGSNDTSKARPNLISKEVLILSKMSLKNTAEDYLNCYPEENRFGNMKSTYPHMNYSKHVKVTDDYDATIIIDNGSGGIKAGLSTEDLPSITPSIIGTPNYQKVFPTEVDQDCWLGWEANRLRGILKLKYPIEYGIVEDWEGMEKLWNHVFDSVLRVDPSEYPVFLTEPPCNSKKNREKMLEIMMETYDVPAYYVGIQAVMSLYSAGRMTGVVLDSGDSVTNAVPVYEGYGLPHAVKKINIGGRNMTDHLRMILSEKGIPFITSAEFEICREIKETECFIATSPEMFDAVSFPSFAKAYELPDGNVITLDSERIRCPEILFRPALIGEDLPGAHELVYQSIINTDIDLRTELFRNIVLSGGATLFPGIEERLKNELMVCSTVNKKNLIKIHSTKERKFSVWKGASILSSLSTFQDMLITNEDYFEVGKSIVHIKCF